MRDRPPSQKSHHSSPPVSYTGARADLRIGAVSYLNTRPLIDGLADLKGEVDIRLTLDLPSRLADLLANGELDVALVPAIELLRRPIGRIVSDACIAADGLVQSVKLFSRTDRHRIRTVAYDEGSRTSVALCDILLRECDSVRAEFVPLPLDDATTSSADAILLIGDRVFFEPEQAYVGVWDLGAWWHAATGHPFVFAVWVARPSVPDQPVGRLLCAARDRGTARLSEIAAEAAPSFGLPVPVIQQYFSESIRYHLTEQRRAGLDRFFELARKHALAE